MSKQLARVYIAVIVVLMLIPLFYLMRWIWFGHTFSQELIDRMGTSFILGATLSAPLPFVIEVFDE